MTLTELRYVVAVARERHFGRAAEACFVSQPTLSVAVKKLEEELDLTLFERGPGEVTVTPAGQHIVEQAQRVLEEASRIKDIAAAGRDPLAAPLRPPAPRAAAPGRDLHDRAVSAPQADPDPAQGRAGDAASHPGELHPPPRRGRRHPGRAAVRRARCRNTRGLRRAVLRRGTQGPSVGEPQARHLGRADAGKPAAPRRGSLLPRPGARDLPHRAGGGTKPARQDGG